MMFAGSGETNDSELPRAVAFAERLALLASAKVAHDVSPAEGRELKEALARAARARTRANFLAIAHDAGGAATERDRRLIAGALRHRDQAIEVLHEIERLSTGAQRILRRGARFAAGSRLRAEAVAGAEEALARLASQRMAYNDHVHFADEFEGLARGKVLS